LRETLQQPRVGAMHFYEAVQLVRKRNLEEEPTVKELLDSIKQKVVDGVRWETPPAQARIAPPPEDKARSLPIALPVAGIGAAVPDGEGVMFAVARGVLYALSQSNGEVAWAWRVGIDTTALPVRLPKSDIAPELVLVLSSDTRTLTARAAQSGDYVWHHQLTSACLSQPVVIGSKVYVPTYDAKVHAIELARGALLGWFDLGQPITNGAAWEDGTNLLYVPADSRFIYVLDVAKRQCVGVLQSDHPNGSLRSAP